MFYHYIVVKFYSIEILSMKYIRLIVINLIVLLILFAGIVLVVYFISVNRINTFFDLKDKDHIAYLIKDSTAMFVHKPNIYIYDNWGTLEQKITTERRTNNLGFREDTDTNQKKDNTIRILVTGDSHTDGVLKKNNQSFINIWENKQNNIDSLMAHDYINGGTAFYTFRNYLGFLKKYKYLQPDVYLINIFTGNDFREAPIFEDNRTNVSNVYKNFLIRFKRKFYSAEKKKIPFAQGIEQTLYFKAFPEEKEKSLHLAKTYLSEINKICKKEDIKLVITLLPPKTDVNEKFNDSIQELFQFSNDDMAINEQLTSKLIDWLNSEKITNFYLKDTLQMSKQKVYWDEDLHINPNGHRVIGEFLNKNVIIEK